MLHLQRCLTLVGLLGTFQRMSVIADNVSFTNERGDRGAAVCYCAVIADLYTDAED